MTNSATACSKMALAEWNQSIETLPFNRADEALGVGVCVRRPIRRPDDADPRVLQACANWLTPLRVPVADQHATHPTVGRCEGPRHLAHERLVRMRRRAEDLNPPRTQLDDKDL